MPLSSGGQGHGTREGAAWASAGIRGAAWQRVVALCWREGLPLPSEPAGHMELSWEQPGAGKWAELCRQLPAWVAVGKGRAARPFSGAVVCPTLVQETRLWDCCHQERTSRVSPAVLYRPSSSCLKPRQGAEHLQKGWSRGCSTLSSLTHVSAQQCPLLLLAEHREPGTALALTGWWLGSASLGRGRCLQSASVLFLGTCSQ